MSVEANLRKNLKNLEKYAKAIEEVKSKHVAVGLPEEKIGTKVYNSGATVAQVGATHEFGSTFTHPGGTGFVIGAGGKARFVSKSFVGPISGITKPHTITIPQRSFLRVPFTTKRKEVLSETQRQFNNVFEKGFTVDKALGRLGIAMVNISKGAFTTRGYGKWKDIRPATKKAKGSSQPLIDTGILRGSITFVVRG